MTAVADTRPTVLFDSVHDPARSQFAQVLQRNQLCNRYHALSAWEVARGVHPIALRVLEELGIDVPTLV